MKQSFVWPTAAGAVGAMPIGWGVNDLAQSGYMLTAAAAWLLGAAVLVGLVSFAIMRTQ